VNVGITLSDNGQGKARNIDGSAAVKERQKTCSEACITTESSSKHLLEAEAPGTEGDDTPILDEMPLLWSRLDRDNSHACFSRIYRKMQCVQQGLAERRRTPEAVTLGKNGDVQALSKQVIYCANRISK